MNLQFIKLSEEDLRILTDNICLAKTSGIYNNLLLFPETAGSLQLNKTLSLQQLWFLKVCPRSAAFSSHTHPTVLVHQFAAADFTLPSQRFMMHC